MSKLLVISSSSLSRPTGGVAMHVHRLVKKVIEPNLINYDLCDYKRENIKIQLKKIRTANVIHVHVSNPIGRIIYAVIAKIMRKKTILTIHGNYGRFNKIKNLVDKIAIKLYDIPILINEESYKKVKSFASSAIYIPAFIPPIEEEEVLSPEIELMITNIKSDNHPLFVTNASRRSFTDKGEEIYGIEFLVNFFAKHFEYNLLFLDPKSQYITTLEGQLPSNVYMLTGAHSFCGLIEKSDLMIRNTPTDGDSFSVKEGLYYHKKVLASDAVSRPKGVFLFKYSDYNSLEKAINNALAYSGSIEFVEEDSIKEYQKLYALVNIC